MSGPPSQMAAVRSVSFLPELNITEKLAAVVTPLAVGKEQFQVQVDLAEAQRTETVTAVLLPAITDVMASHYDTIAAVHDTFVMQSATETMGTGAAVTTTVALQEHMSLVQAAATASEQMQQLQMELAEARSQLVARNSVVNKASIHISINAILFIVRIFINCNIQTFALRNNEIGIDILLSW